MRREKDRSRVCDSHLSDSPGSLSVHGGVGSSCEGVLARQLLRELCHIVTGIKGFHVDTLWVKYDSVVNTEQAVIKYVSYNCVEDLVCSNYVSLTS